MPPFDVFVVLKLECHSGTFLNSNEGLDHFMQTIRELTPRFVLIFDHYKDAQVNGSYLSQLTSIDQSFRLAEARGSYDYFVRYRPDFIMLDTGVNGREFLTDTIYTTKKYDAPASDQVFLISKALKTTWWDKLDFQHWDKRFSLEYIIFESAHNIQNGPLFQGGLLRNNSLLVSSWNTPGVHLVEHPYEETRTLRHSAGSLESRYRGSLHTRMQAEARRSGFIYEYHTTL